jgi:valyl-tRNA synthetase
MGYDIEKVLEACKKTSGISNPNINYVNKVLVNWYEEENGVAVNVDMTPKPVTAAEIQKYYMYLRNKAEDEAQARTREVYSVIPEIRSIEEQMDSCRRQMTKVYLSGADDKESRVRELQNEIKNLNQEKAILMTENDFELDYMGIHYKCEKCKDTGTNDEGGRCECYSLRAKEAETWVRNTNLSKENI